MIYDILSAIIIAVMTALVGVAIYLATRGGRAGGIKFIRSFKKGSFAIIYIAAIPIYWLGYIVYGQEVVPAFFDALSRCMELVVLRFNPTVLEPLMQDSLLFAVAVYYCFALVIVNAVLFYLSIFHQKLWCGAVKRAWKRCEGRSLMIVGSSEECVDIYNSAKERHTVIVDSLGAARLTDLYIKGVRCINTAVPYPEIEGYISGATEREGGACVVISTGDDEKNLELCRKICEWLDERTSSVPKSELESFVISLFSQIKVYVFGAPEYEALYEKTAEASHGCIHYVNKYKLIAVDFTDRYPVSAFIPRKYVNADTTLDPRVKLNVTLVGFGKTNRQIFLSSVANNQFITRDEKGKPVLKQVSYTIFDKESSENNKNLNHTYFRFENEILTDGENEYLELPARPAVTNYTHVNINDPDFYSALRESCRGDGVNMVVIAFGDDLENVDLAEKIIQKKDEWGNKDMRVFVKIRAGNNRFGVFSRGDCVMIGNEREVVYNIDKLTGDRLEEMARARNRLYALESDYRAKYVEKKDTEGKTPTQVAASANYKWHARLSELERESNVYCVLSLRSKLHLMGLDYVPARDAKDPLTADDFERIYSRGELEYLEGHSVEGKRITLPTYEFTSSARGVLALQEHYRWNSYMISHGVVPATVEDIRTEKRADGDFTNGKNYACRRHGNITTAKGLVDFRRIVAERDGCDELDRDVIKYDYQLLDDTMWLLDRCGCALVKKSEA